MNDEDMHPEISSNKQSAISFLELVVKGSIDEAYENYVDLQGTHHNTFTPAGFAALREGMKGADKQFPDMKSETQHVVAEGDLVAVHSHLTLKEGEMEMATVHLFRFKDGKIVELWDIGQKLTPDSPNTDGAF
jgi:predicted SnoaL-like aldol condensation-catalyzing enzyme